MLSMKVVIQKINLDTGSVQLYQNLDLRSPWSFEFDRSLLASDPNPEIFPFIFGEVSPFRVSNAGSETKILKTSENNILFSDDYAIPAGFLIGILFPRGYVPESFKFKDKPFIPTGVSIAGASIRPPGHFDLYHNHKEKLAAIVFITTSDTYFGFKCVAKPRLSDFPSLRHSMNSTKEYKNMSFEEIENQKELLRVHRQTLSIYLLQQAKLGTAHTPPSTENGIREARAAIYRIKTILRDWSETINDHPDDAE